ncbi:fatty-acid-binding protein 2 [Andrographis paniculata]|uniref:fatty-acid-binding protein 2 n=1 Tax=Andrographis paniculata TaxID=175694 RepID=UPI0021E7C6C0|nr:fatty-acid-binding protein 2 [Andrographis paniculata]XP_051151186.1 fatty-acid-binding protein 2 [Andrographis paniculata]XP_051151187.1 fatty-acid-binding protein 2 [Andrographis paniculata]XP_051151188.1 fatty-acid-binding protein 2 [Andrographis paniculata]XP_051151189.1 fatty-acid-binding protein 2 [Andrographis paniculata]XP_051151190.1 fatty-acid-binding protein 2 [Andrographis paniculata]
MGNDWLYFIEPDGSSSGFFLMDPLLSHITSLVDNSRYLFMPGSLAIQEAFGSMSKFSGAVVIWLLRGSSLNINHKLPRKFSCSNVLTQVKHIPSIKCDLTGFFRKSKCRREISAIPLAGKLSNFALGQMWKEVEWLQSFPVLSLMAAMVPPFTNVASNILTIPLEAGSVEAQGSLDQRPCEIENRGCGPCTDLYLQNLAWSKTTEPRTGIEFPTLLDNSICDERSSTFTPEVLVGTGSRTMTIVRIKSLKLYAFGFYVHPFDVCEKLGPKYSCIPEDELYKNQDFYRDLLREDINMTLRLVVNCNGIKINTVKDAFEKALRVRLARTNPDTDFGCLQTFGTLFSKDIPLHVGTTINFRRTADGHLVTEVGGNNLGAVHSIDLCRAFFGMYIGDVPVCEQTKEEIGKNVASIIGTC